MSIPRILMFLNFRVVKMENDQSIGKLGTWNYPRRVAVKWPEDTRMSENQNEERKTYAIFFRDLNPEAQKDLCEIFNITEHPQGWDVFPLFTLEIVDRVAS
jgi:hypothetical protein